MLRELRCAFLIFAAVALLFGAGCVSEKEFEKARFECVELSSGAFADVPECDSPEKCFEELEARAFGFSDEILSFDVRQELYYYKNYAARSWFYFNMARDRAKEIQGVCVKGAGFEKLPTLVNELNNYLTNAFDEADKANKQSIVVLAMESAELEQDQVSMIREEALFDVHVKIHNNLNSATGENKGSSFYANYLKKVREFNELSEKKGFAPLIVESFGFEDLVFSATKKYSKEIVSVFVEKNFLLPFMADSLGSFASFMSGRDSLSESLESLKNSPAFEFMALYSDLLGEHESVLSGFSGLIKEDCVSRGFLEMENSKLEKAAEEKILESKNRLARIPFEEFAFIDSNSFIGLNAFSAESGFSYREFGFESVKEAWLESPGLIESLEFELHELRSMQFLESISIGKKTNRLKELNHELDSLIGSLEFVETELLKGFVLGCEKELTGRKAGLQGEIGSDLKMRIEKEIDSFNKSELLAEKIRSCNKAIELFNALTAEKEGLESKEKTAWNEIGGCIDRLDLFLPALIETNPELAKTVKLFKEEIDSGSFTDETAETCGLLESAVESSLRKSIEAEKIEQNFAEGKKLIEGIKFILGKAPSLSSTVAESLEKEEWELSVFFENGKLVLKKAIENIQSIEWRCRELENKGKAETSLLLSSYLSENYFLKAIPVENAVAGAEFKALQIIDFSNPFYPWNRPMAVSIPFLGEFGAVEAKSSNVVSVKQEKKKLEFEFSSLPEGKSFAEFYSVAFISFTVESKIAESSLLKAELEKTIEFKTAEKISKLSVFAPLGLENTNYCNLRVFFNSQRIEAGIEGDFIVLTPENVQNKDKAFVYLTVLEPFKFEKTIIERKEIDKNQFEEHVLLKVKNNLDYKITAVKLAVPFELNSKFIELIELFDELGARKAVQANSAGLVIETNGFTPKQEKTWILKYRIRNESAYFEGKKEELKSRLGVLSTSASRNISSRALELLGRAAGIGPLEFRENQELLESLFSELQSLGLAQEKENLLNEEIEFIESNISGKLEELEQELKLIDGVQAAEARALIEMVKEKIIEAQKLKKENQSKALNLLYGAQTELNKILIPDYVNFTREKSTQLLGKISVVEERLKSAGLKSKEIELNSVKAREMFLELEELAGKNEFLEAEKKLGELGELEENTRKEFEKMLELNSGLLTKKINRLMELEASIKSKLENLKSEFASVAEEELIETKTTLPFKKQAVEELEIEFNPVSSQYSGKLAGLLQKVSEGSTEEALGNAGELDLDSALEKLELIEERAVSLQQNLKASAMESLANAKEKLKELDGEGIQNLEEAVSEANKNNYLKSLVLSRAALAAAKPQEFDSTLLLYPVFVALAILSVRTLRKKKETQKPLLRRIPRRY